MSFKKILAHIHGVSLKEKIIFTRCLSLIIKAGLSLPQGLETLALQTNSLRFKEVIGEVKDAITKGKDFSESLKAQKAIFDKFYVSMVKTGEATGKLEETLTSLASHMEKERALRSRVLSALMYPTIILCVMVLVMIVMMTFVVPRLTSVFTNFNVDLPASTKLLIGISNFFATYFVFIILSLFFIPFILWYLTTKTRQGAYLISWILVKTPLIGNLVRKIYTARLARTLQTLIQSGVGIVEAITITSEIVGNALYQDLLKKSAKAMEQGKQIHEIFKKEPSLLTPLAIQLIAIGEETGSTDVVLGNLADFYEEEVDAIAKNLPSIIEPLLMVFIGISVGFFAISILQPIYTFTNAIH